MFKLVRTKDINAQTSLLDIARAIDFVLQYMDIDINISDEAHNGYYYLMVAHSVGAKELTENEFESLLIIIHTYVYTHNWKHVEYTADGHNWQNFIDP